ncbi:MAG TPA: cupredoxin family copper-binding protein [Clostridia bacterium]|nr:cupredoxin family copper-binding protein [Clostridia bacterium]
MRRPAALSLAACVVFALAACSSGGSSPTPAATAEASSPATSEAPAGSPAAGAACAVASESGGVAVEIADFTFTPGDAQASVGATVEWTNSDSAPHTATMDDGSCATGNIATGASAALVFNAAGTYAYHCAIHPNMKGTVTIAE